MKPSGPGIVRAALRTVNAASFLFSTSQAFFLLLPVYLQQTGSSPAQIGLVAGLMRASSLLARPLGGRLLERFGRRSVAMAGGCLTILAVLSLFVFPRVGGPFMAMRVLQGVGTSLVDSGLGTLVADLSPPGARAQVFAIYTAWMNLASALMPGLGEAMARHAGFFVLFGAAAVAVVGGLVIVARLPETWRPRPEEMPPAPGLLRGAAPLLLGGVVVGLAYGVLSVFVPVARIGRAPGRPGMFFFAYFAGLIGVRLAGGLGLEWVAQPRSLLPAYGMMAVGLAALPLGDWALLLLGVGILCGASHGVLMPVLYALLLFGVPRERRGWAVALLAAAFDLGNVIGTIGLGLAAETLGYSGIFALTSAIVVLGAGISHMLGAR
jgi:predicted MFS family arabinose efflux permease